MQKKEKIQILLIGAVIMITTVVLSFRACGSTEEERVWIARPEQEMKAQEIFLTTEDMQEKWVLAVEPRTRTEEEIEYVFSETVRCLYALFGIQEGETAVVTQSVLLPQYIGETGAEVRWESSDTSVIAKDGTVERKYLKEACELYLQARIGYAGEEREYWFSVLVPPYEEGSTERLFHEAEEELSRLEKDTSSEAGFYLPENIGAVTVQLPEQGNSLLGVLVIAVLFLPFAVVITKRQEKEKEKKRREEELLAGYPQMVTKLTLYTGAGLSLRGAWERLATEYRAKAEAEGTKGAVCEEILLLAGELKNGTSEAKAYEAFGRRIALKPYLRCAALLVSQLQKGSGSLRKGLENEVQLAWELQRERAAKKGEEAQTKMLFPMMGMLFLVMAVIMIPAFFSM